MGLVLGMRIDREDHPHPAQVRAGMAEEGTEAETVDSVMVLMAVEAMVGVGGVDRLALDFGSMKVYLSSLKYFVIPTRLHLSIPTSTHLQQVKYSTVLYYNTPNLTRRLVQTVRTQVHSIP